MVGGLQETRPTGEGGGGDHGGEEATSLCDTKHCSMFNEFCWRYASYQGFLRSAEPLFGLDWTSWKGHYMYTKPTRNVPFSLPSLVRALAEYR